MKVYGIAEIARALDTDPGLVGKWRERHKLPAPDAELATGPVWLAGTIVLGVFSGFSCTGQPVRPCGASPALWLGMACTRLAPDG